MPQMGVSVAEARSSSGRARGDWVEADEPIGEISTDKVETEVPSPGGGLFTEVLIEVGTTSDVGTVLRRSTPADGRANPCRREHGGNGHAPPISR